LMKDLLRGKLKMAQIQNYRPGSPLTYIYNLDFV